MWRHSRPPPGSARLIGLDLGTQTIGLALSDVTRMIASPLETIRRTKFKADVARLFELSAEHAVAGFVLGFPVSLDGSEGPDARRPGRSRATSTASATSRSCFGTSG